MNKKTQTKKEGFLVYQYLIFILIMLGAMVLSIVVGSVNLPVKETLQTIINSILGKAPAEGVSSAIIMSVRVPRVLCVALEGGALSLCGAAMQGLLQNPLADGSTLGVSSGASLGAVLAIAFGFTIPGLEEWGVMGMSMIFAFLSLMLILSLAYKLDSSLSTYTIILIGVIFSMFANSILSMAVTFAPQKAKNIMFWTMGSLASTDYSDVLTLFVSVIVCGGILLSLTKELNAFAVGEQNALHVGVNVKKVKLIVLITVSVLIGVCVSIGGTIGFVGLVIPHMTRLVVGPNHKKLLPASLIVGATFLMLADLVGRIILKPLELPIGVVTSFIGSITFIYIFYNSRRGN